MTDALSKLTAAASGGTAARLAQYAQEKALAAEQAAAAGKPVSYRPQAMSVLLVPALAVPDAVAAPVTAALLSVEVESRQAVTVEEAQAYGLSVDEMNALAQIRNQQTLGGDRVTETVPASALNTLEDLGLLE